MSGLPSLSLTDRARGEVVLGDGCGGARRTLGHGLQSPQQRQKRRTAAVAPRPGVARHRSHTYTAVYTHSQLAPTRLTYREKASTHIRTFTNTGSVKLETYAAGLRVTKIDMLQPIRTARSMPVIGFSKSTQLLLIIHSTRIMRTSTIQKSLFVEH